MKKAGCKKKKKEKEKRKMLLMSERKKGSRPSIWKRTEPFGLCTKGDVLDNKEKQPFVGGDRCCLACWRCCHTVAIR